MKRKDMDKSASAISVEKVSRVDHLSYLNTFHIEYKTKSGKDRIWELVSRHDANRLEEELFNGTSYTDGAMIFATDESGRKVVILREFRVSAGQFVYMFPAGLIEPGESIENASQREFKEETGLTFHPEYVERERYVSVGIVNERVNIVYGKFSGTPSKAYQEDNEDAEILIIGRDEAIDILKTEEVSIRTAMLLQGFFRINPYFDRE